MSMPLSERNLNPRLVKILSTYNINTLAELLQHNIREIRELPGIGNKAISEIIALVKSEGLDFPKDPYGAYICYRHGAERWDSKSRLFFLCKDCFPKFKKALNDNDPIFVMDPVEGTCSQCNKHFKKITPSWWILCDVCNRVANSIGRGNEAENYAKIVLESIYKEFGDQIKTNYKCSLIEIKLMELPILLPFSDNSKESYIPDLLILYDDKREFGIEIKTGQSSIGSTLIGPNMGQFQLDHGDIEGILRGITEYKIPILPMHVQCINRIDGPSNCHKAVDIWWTSMPIFNKNYVLSKTRPRETKTAAYFNIQAFQPMKELIPYLLTKDYYNWKKECIEGGYEFIMK